MKLFTKASLIAASFLASSTSWAIPHYEIGDAGEYLSSAQSLDGGVDTVYGYTTTASADMYSFYWAGGAFSVDTLDDATIDTQLFLFDSYGQGVWASDGTASSVTPSQIVDPSLAAGQYYLAISLFDYDPFASTGSASTDLVFPTTTFGQHRPKTTLPLHHWGLYHSSGSTDYVLSFRTPTSVPVPEPRTFALFGFALGILLLTQRRMRTANIAQ